MTKNGAHFIVTALPVAEPFKTPTHANQMTCDVNVWTQSGVKSQKTEYLSQLSLYRTET